MSDVAFLEILSLIAVTLNIVYLSKHVKGLQAHELSDWDKVTAIGTVIIAVIAVIGFVSSLDRSGDLPLLLILLGVISALAIQYVLNFKHLVRMYDNKSAYKFENLLNDVKKTYWGLAVSHGLFSTRFSDVEKVVSMLKDSVSFRILIVNPSPNKGSASENGEPEFLKWSQGKIIPRGPEGTIETVLGRFKQDIGAKLTPEILRQENLEEFDWRRRFEVKLYNLPITHTMIIIDRKEKNAKIQLEPYLYLPHASSTPIFIIEKRKRRKVFDAFVSSFENAWNDERTIPVSWDSL